MHKFFIDYKNKLESSISSKVFKNTEILLNLLIEIRKNKKKLFFCGNGGSAGNANHIANDFLYGVSSNSSKPGFNVESLSSNSSVITCLANDLGYQYIFSEQLKAKGNDGDLLIVLSGSGNSENIVKALNEAKKIKMNTFAILGFDGGKCIEIADNAIHFDVNDMQISEDLQLVVMHMCMQWLSKN